MAAQRELVLPVPADAELGRHVLGGNPHVRIAQAVRRKPGAAEEGGVAVVVPVCPQRGGADAFHSAGQIHAAAGGDQPGRQDDGIQPGAALPVDGEARDGHGETGLEGGQTRNIPAPAHGVADDHISQFRLSGAGFGQQGGQDRCEEFVGPELLQRSVGPADGRSQRGDDDRLPLRRKGLLPVQRRRARMHRARLRQGAVPGSRRP